MKAAKFSPYLPAASNLLEGDLVGAGLSVAGAGIGKALTGRLAGAAMGAKLGPWGALAGGILGEPVIKGVVGENLRNGLTDLERWNIRWSNWL